MDAVNLTFDERVRLVELMMALRQNPPIGVVGLIETRNLLSLLFPEYAAIRDEDLDNDIRSHVEQQAPTEMEDPRSDTVAR